MAGESWRAWRVLLVSLMGEPLDDAERAVFKRLTGREREPGEPVEEFLGLIGRRGGKSFAMAVLIVFLGDLPRLPRRVECWRASDGAVSWSVAAAGGDCVQVCGGAD